MDRLKSVYYRIVKSKYYRAIKSGLYWIVPGPVKHMMNVYQYRVYAMTASSTGQKLNILKDSFRSSFMERKRIFFYPEKPMDFCVIYKILMFSGYYITADFQKDCRLAIRYWHGFDGNPFSPDESSSPLMAAERDGVKVLNMRCNDISKNKVNSVFEEVFGYALSVDPRTHKGKCVMKSNWNALHKGQTIECPTEPHEGDFVYQKLIRNETEEGLVVDMRVPVYGNVTPFVYIKYRRVKDRFVDREHTNTKAAITEVCDVLSNQELNNIYLFCGKIGLDYGEVDVLRDKDDGKIYIVDANTAPSGPPSPISDDDRKIAVIRLAQAFEEAFGP